MAKMKDDHFELVVNIQRFTPEEVRVYLDGQAVIVAAKHETSDGFVTGKKTKSFRLFFTALFIYHDIRSIVVMHFVTTCISNLKSFSILQTFYRQT